MNATEIRPKQTGETGRKDLILLLLLALFMLGMNLGCRDLWAPDEPRYAGIAREMMAEDGGWFLPTLNGESYYNKPPGYFWLIAACSLPAGEVNDITARLPSVFLGTAILLLLFLWLRRYREGSPFPAVLILLSSYLFWWFGSRVNIDISFAFFITAACLAFHHGYRKSGGKWSGFYAAAYLAVGTGLIVKGPFALLPIPVIIVFMLMNHDRKAISGLKLHRGFALLLIPILVWLIPALITGGRNYFDHAVLEQVGGRIAKSYSHPHGPLFYLYILPANFMPWGFILIAALIGIARKRIDRDEVLRFSLAWLGVVFIVMSLVSAKQPHYLLPLFPAAAVIAAQLFRVPRWIGARIAIWTTLAVLSLITLALPVVPAVRYRQFLPAGIILFFPLAAILFTTIRGEISGKRSPGTLMNIFLFMFVLTFAANIWLLPTMNALKSQRQIVEPYLLLDHRPPIAAYCQPSDWSYYFPYFVKGHIRRLFTGEDLQTFADSREERYLLSRKKEFDKLPDDLRDRYRVILTRKLGSKRYILAVTGGSPS